MKRSLTILAGIALAAVTTIFSLLGLRRWPARLVELHYPVIAIRADHSYAFVADGFRVLKTPTPSWAMLPNDGTILIDSDFNVYVERDVRCTEGDLGWLFRRFVGPTRSATYAIGLDRADHSGPAAAHEHLAACESFAWEDDADAVRRAIAPQTTMAGIVAILTRRKPVAPVAATQVGPFETEGGER